LNLALTATHTLKRSVKITMKTWLSLDK